MRDKIDDDLEATAGGSDEENLRVEPDSELAELILATEADPGHVGFPRLAEAFRRVGKVDHALTIASEGLRSAPERLGGKVALALALIDSGEISEAVRELAGILENVPEISSESPAAVPDEPREPADALGQADAPAVTADGVTIEHPIYGAPLAPPSESLSAGQSELESGDALGEDEIDRAFESAEADPDQMMSANRVAEQAMRQVDEPDHLFSAVSHPRFATPTMAALLQEQGDHVAAEEVLAAIPEPEIRQSFDTAEVIPAPELASALDAASLLDASSGAGAHEGVESEGQSQSESRERVLTTLDRWLENIRREVV